MPIKMYKKSHLFMNVFQHQMAKFNNMKPQLLLHQLNIGSFYRLH